MKNKKPLLIATLGYPGSGKTHFSEHLAKDFNLFHINADKIRSEMFDAPMYSPEEHRAVFGFIDWLTEGLLSKGISVIVDANTNKRAHRKKFYTMADKWHATFLLIYINTPLEVAESRLSQRGVTKNSENKKYYPVVDSSVLHHMKKRVEYPGKDEKFLVINGLDPYTEQVKSFKKWLLGNSKNKRK